MLLFAQDPTVDLAHLASLTAVIRDGRLYPIETIRETVDDILDYFRSPLVNGLAQVVTRRVLAKAMQ